MNSLVMAPVQRHWLPGLAVAAFIGLVWALNRLGFIDDVLALVLCLGAGLVAVAVGPKFRWLERGRSGEIIRLAVPVVLAMMSQTAVNLVDTAFVGHLPSAVALPGVTAIGISLLVFWLVGGFLSALSVGTQVITARRHGEGREEMAGQTLMSAATVGLFASVIFSLIGYWLLPSVLPFFNQDPNVVEQGIIFSRIRYIGICSMVVTAVYKAFFDGIGATRVHMVAAIIMNITNVVLCYGLVFGELGMPRLEVAGAAWASTVASFIGTFVMVFWSLRKRMVQKFRLYRLGAIRMESVMAVVRLSLPSGMATIIGMMGFLLFHKAVGRVDAMSNIALPINAAATAVIQQILMVIFLASFAFGTATSTLVSRSLGRGDPGAARNYAMESVKLGMLFMATAASFLFVFPEEALSLFIEAKNLGEHGKLLAIEAGVGPLQLMAVMSTVIAAAVVFTQALYGSGNTRFVMIVEGVLHLSCLVPLAWLFGVILEWGLFGVWGAVGLYVILLAVIMGIKFTSGDWAQIKV